LRVRWNGSVGRLFPEAPDGNVAEVEGIPPEIHLVLVELQNAVACNTDGRRDESGEALENFFAVCRLRARGKMPERKFIIFAGLRENDLQCGCAGFRREILEIELGERSAKGLGCIFEIGSAWA